ncbi:T cell receptor alpha chain variable region, partial [Clarias magur]
QSTQDSITPTSSAVYGKEGEAVTLSCSYTCTVTMSNLQWYRQYPNVAPEFLVLLLESGGNQTGDTPHPHLT